MVEKNFKQLLCIHGLLASYKLKWHWYFISFQSKELRKIAIIMPNAAAHLKAGNTYHCRWKSKLVYPLFNQCGRFSQAVNRWTTWLFQVSVRHIHKRKPIGHYRDFYISICFASLLDLGRKCYISQKRSKAQLLSIYIKIPHFSLLISWGMILLCMHA